MSEVKRYWIDGPDWDKVEDSDGELVLYEDYAELVKRYQELFPYRFVRCADDQLMVEVYEYLQDQINSHIGWKHHGMSCCDEGSLCASVTESFEYLLEFWIKNRDKENIEHP